MKRDWIGYRWLAERYSVRPVQPFRTESSIGRARSTAWRDGFRHEQYLPQSRPADNLAGHLTFALKHEGVHLEFLSRLFSRIGPDELDEWTASEPTGQYARRAGFFYEWLTGERLQFAGVTAGNYVSAVDDAHYWTATAPCNDKRWRVRDNLPGTPSYCPIVDRTDRIRTFESYSCADRLQALEAEFGTDIIQRSVVWLATKESKASFTIEKEEKQVDRIRRFAEVMEQQCGQIEEIFSTAALTELQRRILGPHAIRYGVRRSPVFVGESHGYNEIVHYIAPPWDELPSLMAGLRAVDERTAGSAPLVRAAVLSFGFVYIHPLADGNGRVSRFLINDVLRRDGAVPAPFILPVSATITSSSINRRGYDQILETISRQLMKRYADDWSFGKPQGYEDGVESNLRFESYEDALHTWRYPDFTAHAEYLAAVVQETIDTEMRQEAAQIRTLRTVREAVKGVLDGPDPDIDRIIRAIRTNGGSVSNKLRKEFPALEGELGRQVAEAVQAAFAEAPN